jgi:hypothetical protein
LAIDRSSKLSAFGDGNTNGSADIYFGAKMLECQEKNWNQTALGKGWFSIFRVYGPLQPLYDKSWKLPEYRVGEIGDPMRIISTFVSLSVIAGVLIGCSSKGPAPTTTVETLTPDEARALAKEAYVFAFPLPYIQVQIDRSTAVTKAQGTRAPINQFGSFRPDRRGYES